MKSIYSIALIGFMLLQGCASAPRLQNMVPEVDRLSSKQVTLSVGNIFGGSETDPMNVSKIESEGFGQALVDGLHQSGLFTAVTPGGNGDYELNATILTQDQPMIGLALKVDLAVKYVVIERASQEVVFDSRIVSSYKARMGEAFVATARLRKANEGAVRDNIKQLIEALSAVPFS